MTTSQVNKHHANLFLFIAIVTAILVFLLATPILGGGGTTTFSAARIKALRTAAAEATEVPERTPDGWSKSTIEPTKLLELFKPLRLRHEFVLRAYQFKEAGNGNGVVWAMPADSEFPQPDDCPRLENHLLKAPKPADALDDVMEAIEGDESAWSYLAASLLRREFREFGALWHGISWRTHTVLDADPWKSTGVEEEGSLERPTSRPSEWKWLEPRPQTWNPQVTIEKERLTVTFYTYSGLKKQAIYRHTDTYRLGKYRPRVEEKRVAEGPPGYMF